MKHYEISAGLVSGLLTIILFGAIYSISPRWMLHPFLYWGSMVIFLGGMLGACLLAKRRGNGVLSFREGVRNGFLTFVIANCLFLVFYYLLFNWVNPELPQIQLEMMQEYAEQNLMGKELRDQKEWLATQNFKLEFSDLIFGFARGAIGGFLLSLIIALVVRQEA